MSEIWLFILISQEFGPLFLCFPFTAQCESLPMYPDCERRDLASYTVIVVVPALDLSCVLMRAWLWVFLPELDWDIVLIFSPWCSWRTLSAPNARAPRFEFSSLHVDHLASVFGISLVTVQHPRIMRAQLFLTVKESSFGIAIDLGPDLSLGMYYSLLGMKYLWFGGWR